MDKTAHIFVTGHKELVGAAVLRRLKAEGCKNILTTDIDLTDAEAVNNFFKKEKPAYVIAAAGRSGGIMENRRVPADFMHDNLSIALNILEAAHRNGVQKLVYLCSSCMYPSYCPQPMKEDQLFSGRPDENSLPTAVSKLAALQLCLSYNQQYGATRFIPAIPNNTYGPEDDFDLSSGHVLAALIRRFHEAKKKGLQAIELWGSGTPRREFVHADDVAAACLLLLQAPLRDKDLPINIGTGQDCTIRELAESIAAVAGFAGKITWDTEKPDGAPRKLLDNSRLLHLGWSPAISLQDGIQQTYRWYLDNAATEKGRAQA